MSDHEYSCPNHGPDADCGVVQALRARIALLEAVAGAALAIAKNYPTFITLTQILRAAGYLKEQGDD
jgi:hypothetical protein